MSRFKVSSKKLLILLIISMLALGGCSSEEKPSPNDTAVDTPAEKEEPKKVSAFEIGDLIEDKNYTLKVNQVTYSDGNDFMLADDGNTFIVTDLTIENTSDVELAVSSLLSFEMKDDDGRKQEYALNIDQNGQLDGQVLPGEKLSGEITFQVAKEGNLHLYYTNEVFTGKPVKIKVR